MTLAVRGVSFEAYFGEILLVVGPSGSGKTTMLSMISGSCGPNEGSVEIDGTDIWRLSADELAEFRLKRLGFVFQDYHLFPRLTTAENVAVPLILQRRDWQEALTEAQAGPRNRRPGHALRIAAGQTERRRAAAGGNRPRDCRAPRHSGPGRADGLAGRRHRAQHREIHPRGDPERVSMHHHRHP